MPHIVVVLLLYNYVYYFCHGSNFDSFYDEHPTCSDPGWSRCTDGDCIPNSYKCDKWIDCIDGSDEENCDDVIIPNPCKSNPCFQLCMLNRTNDYTCGCNLYNELKSDDLTFRDRHLFRTGLTRLASLTTIENNIFWTQRNSGLLYWIKYNENIDISSHQIAFPLENVTIHEEHPCHKNNGNCSHVCLVSSVISFICAYPGMMLSANNRTCILQSTCSGDEIKCSKHDICIKQDKWYNGTLDCPNGEDESGDCKETSIWEKDQFMCIDRTCISSTSRCNSTYECADKSDEEKDGSGDKWKNVNVNISNICDEFMCSTGTCLPYSKVCDGILDCPDNSDENGKCRTLLQDIIWRSLRLSNRILFSRRSNIMRGHK